MRGNCTYLQAFLLGVCKLCEMSNATFVTFFPWWHRCKGGPGEPFHYLTLPLLAASLAMLQKLFYVYVYMQSWSLYSCTCIRVYALFFDVCPSPQLPRWHNCMGGPCRLPRKRVDCFTCFCKKKNKYIYIYILVYICILSWIYCSVLLWLSKIYCSVLLWFS